MGLAVSSADIHSMNKLLLAALLGFALIAVTAGEEESKETNVETGQVDIDLSRQVRNPEPKKKNEAKKGKKGRKGKKQQNLKKKKGKKGKRGKKLKKRRGKKGKAKKRNGKGKKRSGKAKKRNGKGKKRSGKEKRGMERQRRGTTGANETRR